MEYVTVKDPFSEEKKEDQHPHIMHIFESNLPQSTSNSVSDDINVY